MYGRVKETDLPDGAYCIKCKDRNVLDMHTNESFYEFYDALKDKPKPELEVVQQQLGLKLNPDGLLHSPYIRTILMPADHMLRDWMHILVNNGVANSQIAFLTKALVNNHITLKLMEEFMMQFNLPARQVK